VKKLLDFGPFFGSSYDSVANNYEPIVQKLEVGEPQNMEKTAATMSDAYKYAESLKPKDGVTYILVIAMGAGEYYGSNKNGDYFPEKDLKLQYKNFETKFVYPDSNNKKKREITGGALFFKHHKNKPHKGHPWFGIVHKAFYNEYMHRVELIIEIIHSREGAMEIVDEVNAGKAIAVSMGVNVPYDTCNRCGNKAVKQEEYCIHLQTEMNVIRADGTKTYAINGDYDYKKYPKGLNFFDISKVFRPADQIGWMLKKVAQEGAHYSGKPVVGSAFAYEKQAELYEKAAELQKMSDITKYVQGQAAAIKGPDSNELKILKGYPEVFEKVVSQMEPMRMSHIEKLSKYPMKDILTTLSSMGIIITTPEFIQLVVRKKTGVLLSLDELKKFSVNQAKIFEEMAEVPESIDEISNETEMFKQGSVVDGIQEAIQDIAGSRDLSTAGFQKKATTDIRRSVLDLESRGHPWADMKGMDHVEVYTDPQSGKQFNVSTTAVEDAQVVQNIKDIAKIVGGAGLLGGTYLLTRKKYPVLSPIAGVGALALGAKGLMDMVTRSDEDTYLQTDEGTHVPQSTHMYEKKSAVIPKAKQFLGMEQPTDFKSRLNKKLKGMGTSSRMVGTFAPVALTALANQYYKGRIRGGTAGTYRTELERNLDNVGRFAYNHPLIMGALGVTASHVGLNALSKLRKLALGR